MQQAEKAAAKAKSKRRRGFHFERETCIIQAQFTHCGPQILKFTGIDRKQAAEHNRLSRLETGQCLARRAAILGNRIANPCVGDFLDRCCQKADFTGSKLVHCDQFRREYAHPVNIIGGIGAHHPDFLALFQFAIDNAHQHDDAEISIIVTVNQHGLQRGIRIACKLALCR